MRILISGGGAAAVEAAVAARKTAPDAEIIMVMAEDMLPYRRPMLSTLLKGEKMVPERFFIKQSAFYEANDITLLCGRSVTGINGRSAVISDGSVLEFDKLVIATGAGAFKPPVPGAELKNVFTLRTFADMENILSFIRTNSPRRAAVIGGGVLGLEIADAMLSHDMHLTVIENNPRLFARALDESASESLCQDLCGRYPALEFRFNANVSAVTEKSVEFADGTICECDMVFFSCGARAETALARAGNIEVGRAIKVNSRMESSLDGVYACGDAVELDGQLFGLYSDAMATGKVAGTNAAGGDAVYEYKKTPVRCFTLGLKLVMP